MTSWDPTPKDARTEARADAAAAKARAKALRPWYRKKRFILPLVLLAIIIIAVAASAGGKKDKKVDTTATTVAGSTATTAASSSGNSAHPPQADAKITECAAPDVIHIVHAKGTVTNSTSKASNYIIHVAFLQGATRVAEGYAAANEVQAGQTATWDAAGSQQLNSAATCQITSVERYASRP